MSIGRPTIYRSIANITFFSLPDILPKLDTRLVQMCRKIGISDSRVAEDGINELNELLDKPGASIMQNYGELYVENICLRFKVSRVVYGSLIHFFPNPFQFILPHIFP